MLLSFKTALIPNNRQITAFRKASGVARHGK
ncbi:MULTISPECIES: helix-turn-helix domain-containing protein [Nostocales]|uniref:Helix-turn-helix domain-containing protein n=1 Tax=Dolichospermum heterosporum TAC447 TaxID=747523 RepID=A0ABY5M260_9CYAN|nr:MULTISPECIES: helix-turn-helix domain-containing protein [Nostocales]MCX5984117.1 helix-turn-helix domain-containing protein [Nostocales cyanobacterium LacPavin_0920_SED1_MAG_38_18]UUO17314.1 helix-turn-helix domain-containing protein [Dolichospermum heterosporum TAC447]